eukprot:Em0023g266a
MLYNRSSITFVENIENEHSLGNIIMKHYSGTRVNNSMDGRGIAEFVEGHTYAGDFHNGLMHGRGRYTWKDGLVYEGEFSSNHLCGLGTYTWPDGSTYTGDVKDGVRDGYGTFDCPAAGVKYTGQWANGKRHGKGRLVYDSPVGESYYDGEWLDDQQTGWGQRCYKSGNMYKGEWLGNRRHGQGIMYWNKQREQYSGEWTNGVQHGHGEHIWFMSVTDKSQYPLQNSYVGEWKNGKRDGFGTFHYASGAMYIGQWSCNQKEGQGKYVFQNGQVYEGMFTKDRMATDSKDLRTTIRPQTPLGDLLGDRGTSCTEQFDINVSPLIPPSCDVAQELRQVHASFVRHISQLRRVYHVYSSLDDPLGRSGCNQSRQVMTRMQLWQLLKDCKLQHVGMSLNDADNIIDNSHEPTTPFLMREFLQALVFLAHHLFHNREDCQSPSAGLLAQCFTYFISAHMVVNAGSKTGLFYSTDNMSEWIGPYLLQCWDVFCCLRLANKGSVTLRAILLLLKACGLVGEYLTSETAVHILLEDNPLTGDGDSCNLDIKVVFLEFVEILLHCARCWYTSKQQKEHAIDHPALASTYVEATMDSAEHAPDTDNAPGTDDQSTNAAGTTGAEPLAESTYKWEEILKSFFSQFLPVAKSVLRSDS